MNNCPKCDTEYNEKETECRKCGVIFAKYLQYQYKLKKQHQTKLKEEESVLLTNCPVCQKDISINAEACPHCGESNKKGQPIDKKESTTKRTFTPKKEKPSLIVIVGGGFILFCVFIVIFGEYLGLEKSEPTPVAKTKIETRDDKIEKAFSLWDGSHRNLTKIIKDSMNDNSSYEHVKTIYWDMKDHLVVLTTFRGKNAFGGVVKNSVKAKVDLDGNVLEIIEQFHQ